MQQLDTHSSNSCCRPDGPTSSPRDKERDARAIRTFYSGVIRVPCWTRDDPIEWEIQPPSQRAGPIRQGAALLARFSFGEARGSTASLVSSWSQPPRSSHRWALPDPPQLVPHRHLSRTGLLVKSLRGGGVVGEEGGDTRFLLCTDLDDTLLGDAEALQVY
jgi:hypothetical protein